MTALRREVQKDAELLAKAKAVMAEELDGDDPRRRFEAAKALASFRAAPPPAELGTQGDFRGSTIAGRRPVGVGDLLSFAFRIRPEETERLIQQARDQARHVALEAADGTMRQQAEDSRVGLG